MWRLFRLPVLLSASVASVAFAESIRLRILDENGRPAAARIRQRDKDGRLQPLPAATHLETHPRFRDLGVIVRGDGAIEVSDPGLTIEVDRGTEYLPQAIPPGKGATHEIRLKR